MRTLIAVWLFTASSLPGFAAGATETALDDGALGKLALYSFSAEPKHVVLFVSGDGGWAGIDRDLAAALAQQGIPVIGWDSLRYLWSPRRPAEVGADLERVLRHYLGPWHRERVLLMGYSLGAETLPVMAGLRPADLKARVDLVALLAPGKTGRLEFHVGDWLGSGGDDGIALAPEVERLGAMPVLCVYGTEEAKDSLCPQLHGNRRRVVGLPGIGTSEAGK